MRQGVGSLVEGVSAAGMPASSHQGGIHRVPWNELPSPVAFQERRAVYAHFQFHQDLRMSEHNVTIRWQRTTPDFEYKTFDRTHIWRFSGGETVRGSSAPAYFGDPALVNPEEGLVAALSSCQMLTFLSIAALKGLVIERYEDNAAGELSKNDQNRMFVSKITLRPRVVFGGATPPDAGTLAELHQQAKKRCFVGNSLLTEIVLEPR